MRTSFTAFWRRNLAFSRLAVLQQLEYRTNLFVDAIAQPVCTALIELTLWTAIFAVSTSGQVAGFTKEYYFAYVIWGTFVARTTANWMYEFKMIEEIDSGSINGLLVRPMTFFEYYLSQFLGYKFITGVFAFLFPVAVILIMGWPTDFTRVPIVLLLITYYLVFAHILSFIVCSIAFYFNRIHAMTVAKNLALWFLGGEMVPLDMVPEPYRQYLLALPFCNAVFIPVGYITGRVSIDLVWQGFASITVGIIVFGSIAMLIWKRGVSQYAGTGA